MKSPRYIPAFAFCVVAVAFYVKAFSWHECALLLGAGFWIRALSLRARVLEAKKNNMASLVENCSDIVLITGSDSRIRYINAAGKRTLGLSPELNLKGVNVRQFLSDEEFARLEGLIADSLSVQGNWSGEVVYKNQSTGEDVPTQAYLYPLYIDGQAEPFGYASVGRDIRERRQRERRLDRFFELSLDMLGIASVDGRFIRMNPAFSQTLGFTEEELCSRPSIEFIHPEDIARTIAEIEKQSRGQSVSSFENRYRTKSGEYRWLSWKSIPDGDLTFGVARDITEEKRQRHIMEKLSSDAIAASQAKSDFLANMSHEIRTPLNGVIGMTTLLLDSSLDEDQKSYAENVRSSAESLLTIINDILDFSKIEAGKLDIEELDFSIEALVVETAKTMQWATKNKSLTFTVDCPQDAASLFRGDPGRIRQILTNLLTNAIKFTHEGSIRLEVTALKKTENDTLFTFSIFDTGIGLSPAAQAKLFQAFSQADASTSRKFGGTGLGLSISRRLTELMGGQIGVESEEHKGSRFWFALPLKHSTVAVAPKRTSQIIKSKFPGAHILVAEDNMVNQMILLAMLRKLGFKPQAVASGVEVLNIIAEKNFDLILMDCHMPELDGYETTRMIRDGNVCPRIPIVALTANAIVGDKEKCLAAGMNDYASKPVHVESLSQTIEKWLILAAEDQKRSA